jgi:hypothetical protein
MYSRSAAGEPTGKAPIHGMHGQMPDHPELAASFILAGPHIPRGKMLERVSMLDVAPTIARLTEVSLPNTAGRPIELKNAEVGMRNAE